MNKERTIVTLLREISKEDGYDFKTYSYDWVKELSKGGNSIYIHGYNFPANDTSFTQIANDKACTSEVLSAKGIPNVEHSYFMSPNDIHYVKYLGVDGNWKEMIRLLDKHGKIVVKPNSGTGGAGIKIVSDEVGLEKAVNEIFSFTSTLCICPYYEIEDEFRVIILDGVPEVVFKKVRPSVYGNGFDNVGVLCAKEGKSYDSHCGVSLSYIPQKGEKVNVGWKHNLGQGSAPEVLKSGDAYKKAVCLATRTLLALGGKFASVDCVSIGGNLRVLEVNSGVMMDNFANTNEDNYKLAKSIYKKAIDKYFSLN